MTLPAPKTSLQSFLEEAQRRRKTPPTVQQSLQDMPNYSKLTSNERGIYNKLAGVPKGWMDMAEKVGNSWVGKGLMVFDSLAEGLERGIGTAIQFANNDADDFNFKDAWNAGSLTYDVTNLPTKKRHLDTGNSLLNTLISFNPFADEINSDLPGASYLAGVRKNISEGMTIDEAKEDLYRNLGARALACQRTAAAGPEV